MEVTAPGGEHWNSMIVPLLALPIKGVVWYVRLFDVVSLPLWLTW